MHDPLTKAAVADRRQSDLFTTPAVIAGHMRGPVYVAPYTARRRRRPSAPYTPPPMPPGRIITTTNAERLLPPSFAAAAEEMRQRLMPHHVIRLDAADSATHPSGLINATRRDLEYGQDNDIPPYGNGTHDFTITINVANETRRLRPAADVVHTLLHEFGHAFQFARFHEAPAATQEAIRAQWADETRRATDASAGHDVADAASVRRWVSRGLTETEMRPTLDANLKHTAPYYRRFEEWFAEKFAAWMTNRETDTPVVRFFEAGRLALMEAWRRALTILGVRDLAPTSAGGAFERFLDDTWTTGGRPMRKAIIFLKARIPGGAMDDLFAQPVQVAGHTRKDGVFVAPHQATRLKAPVAMPPAQRRRKPMQDDLLNPAPTEDRLRREAMHLTVEDPLFGLDVATDAKLREYADNRRSVTPKFLAALEKELRQRAINPGLREGISVQWTGTDWAVVAEGKTIATNPETGESWTRHEATLTARAMQKARKAERQAADTARKQKRDEEHAADLERSRLAADAAERRFIEETGLQPWQVTIEAFHAYLGLPEGDASAGFTAHQRSVMAALLDGSPVPFEAVKAHDLDKGRKNDTTGGLWGFNQQLRAERGEPTGKHQAAPATPVNRAAAPQPPAAAGDTLL